MRLGVNVDHIATLRNVRVDVGYPSLVDCAILAEEAGADNITTHLRADFRHIRPKDITDLKRHLSIPLNVEVGLGHTELIDFVIGQKPHSICLVPENPSELTTEGGLDLLSNYHQAKSTIHKIQQNDISVSLFIEPSVDMIKIAKEISAQEVEIHTGGYAKNPSKESIFAIVEAAKYASKIGLKVNAGHALSYTNVKQIAQIAEIAELNIGHSIVSRAVLTGMAGAVREMKLLLCR